MLVLILLEFYTEDEFAFCVVCSTGFDVSDVESGGKDDRPVQGIGFLFYFILLRRVLNNVFNLCGSFVFSLGIGNVKLEIWWFLESK